LADLVRADEDALVSTLLGHDRQPHPGVAGRRLDDGAARLEQAALLGVLDHLDRDAVLGAAARVQVLDLGQHHAGALRDHRIQLDQGRIADELTDVPGISHASMVPDIDRGANSATRWPRGCTRRSAATTVWPPARTAPRSGRHAS